MSHSEERGLTESTCNVGSKGIVLNVDSTASDTRQPPLFHEAFLQLRCACFSYGFNVLTLKMEAIRSSEMSVNARSTQRHIPQDDILHSHRCECLKSYKNIISREVDLRHTQGNPMMFILSHPFKLFIFWYILIKITVNNNVSDRNYYKLYLNRHCTNTYLKL
jgi:hypothetical protein